MIRVGLYFISMSLKCSGEGLWALITIIRVINYHQEQNSTYLKIPSKFVLHKHGSIVSQNLLISSYSP